MERQVFSEKDAQILRKMAQLDKGRRFIRQFILFRAADDKERNHIVEELNELLEGFTRNGHGALVRDVNDILRERVEQGAPVSLIEREVNSIIGGKKELCRTS